MGRKSRYETHVLPKLEQITEWYTDTDEREIARKLGVSVSSFERYKQDHEELREALKDGKQRLITELKTSLKKKAKGYYYTEKKTSIRQENGKEVKYIESYEKYAQPDTGAIHLLLKNLDPDWTNDDKQTMQLKKEQLELAKIKHEDESW